MKKILLTLAVLVALLPFGDNPMAFSKGSTNKYITIGTGGVTGVYYPAGGAICRLVNRGRKNHGIRCAVESTSGSIYNIESLREEEIDVAVAQSDWQYHAYNGTAHFEKQGAMRNLRSMFSLHSEPMTIVVRKNSGINTLNDIKGKVVNIGDKGSGVRATFKLLMKSKGWTLGDFKAIAELGATQQAKALCDGAIDVMVYAAGHPNGAVQEATTSCDSKIIPIDRNDSDIVKLLQGSPYYTWVDIPGGMYAGNSSDVETVGVRATFLTTEGIDEDIVYNIVKAVFDNFDNFKTLHPVFTILQKNDLVTDGNTAPLHKGAIRYFKESGMLD